MVQMSRTQLQALINTDIIENTAGLITATQLNGILTDITDSFQTLPTGALLPSVRAFVLIGQPTAVTAGTTLSGVLTIAYNINEPGNVQGNLRFLQDGVELVNNIDPTVGAANITINNVTLNAGDTTVFRLEGTAVAGVGGAVFFREITVRALAATDFIYYGLDADTNPADFDINTAQSAIFSTTQVIMVPTFTGNQHFVIAQRASDPQITQLIIGGIDQLAAFTRTPNAFLVSGLQYDAYVSDNALVGSIVSGDRVEIRRT
jgi:hypothetical protein